MVFVEPQRSLAAFGGMRRRHFRGRVDVDVTCERREGAWPCSAAAEEYDMGLSEGEGESETAC